MKKHLLLFFLTFLPMLASADAKDSIHVSKNTDQMELLYGKWWLVGWNDGGINFEVDTKSIHLRIEIPRDGYVMAYSMVNEIFVGLLTLNGNEIILGGERRGMMTEVYCDIMENRFFEGHICDIKSYLLEGNLLKLYYTDNDYFVFTSNIEETKEDYRPFVEDGKVWKVGNTTGISDGIVKWVKYYYFDGDTIINGKTCKKMVCQQYVSPDHPDYAIIVQSSSPSLRYIGAWYEEDKKVYAYNEINQHWMMYDFSLEANDTLLFDNYPYVIGPKQTGGLNGFKGVYRNVMWRGDEAPYYCTTWLEGVGGIDGPTLNIYYGKEGHTQFLMSCTVGDEVIYLNDEYEDGATPERMEVRKKRFDFTHTVKTKPKSRIRRGEEQSLYGEYNDQHLGIHLNPLDDAYQVRITNESGQVVYEKTINAGNIVGLNIDISAYAEGRYTVTVENSDESFTGEFDAQTTGIEAISYQPSAVKHQIYNLQGQRLSSLQKGLNIVNGRKIHVK